MRILCASILCCIALQSAFGGDTNLTLIVDGVAYSNVTFGTVSLTTVKIFHSSGIAALPLAKLSPEFQKQLGYDPQKVAAFQDAKRQAVLEDRLKYLRRIDGVIYDFSPVVIARKEWKAYIESEAGRNDEGGNSPVRMRLARAEQRYEHADMLGYVVQVLEDGLLVNRLVGDDKRLTFVRNYRGNKSVVDGDFIRCFGMEIGRHSYTDVAGAKRTVTLWDCGEPVKESELNGEIVPFPPQSSSREK